MKIDVFQQHTFRGTFESLKTPENYRTIFWVSKSDYSYLIYDPKDPSYQILELSSYSCIKGKEKEFTEFTIEHLNKLGAIYPDSFLFQYPDKFTLVPSNSDFDIYKKEWSNLLLNESEVEVDSINSLELIVLHLPEMLLKDYLTFNPIVKSEVSSFLFSSLKSSRNENYIELQFSENSALITFYKNGVLMLCNKFDFAISEDILYFTLAICQEFEIDKDEIRINLEGKISQKSDIYSNFYRYFNKLEVGSSSYPNFSKSLTTLEFKNSLSPLLAAAEYAHNIR